MVGKSWISACETELCQDRTGGKTRLMSELGDPQRVLDVAGTGSNDVCDDELAGKVQRQQVRRA
jgi:hypothetical protein